MTFLMQKNGKNLKKEIIYVVNEKVVDDFLACQILSNVSLDKKIGLDMKKVESIKSPILIEYMLENKVKLFNLQSEVLAYFSLIFKSGHLKSFMNFTDFKENKRELVKRNFLVV